MQIGLHISQEEFVVVLLIGKCPCHLPRSSYFPSWEQRPSEQAGKRRLRAEPFESQMKICGKDNIGEICLKAVLVVKLGYFSFVPCKP